jgi:hypothetical protein
MTILGEAGGLADGPARGALMQRVADVRWRMKTGTRVVMTLQGTALVLMSVGHYV